MGERSVKAGDTMGLYESARIIHNGVMPDDIRLSVLCSTQEKTAFQLAADLLGLSLTGFILMTVRKATVAVLREHGKPVPFLDLPNTEVDDAEKPGDLERGPLHNHGKRGSKK